ncbi:MAG: hypothetical protein AB7I32_02540 [Gammaproteobacteria bacterium]
MIKPEDAEFHAPPGDDFRWCETNPLLFNIPQARISGVLYVVTRPVLGVCMSDVTVQDRYSFAWEDALYVDNQQHLPCPRSLLDYTLPNGLSVRVLEPLKRSEFRYEGIDDTRIELSFEALMDPYDMNDPAMDPLAAGRASHGWAKAFGGHFEITGRVRGVAVLRGTRYEVDCIDTLDRSWGPRQERDNANAIWLHGSFGEGLTVHALLAFDPARGDAFGPLVSGYVLEDGQVYGLTACTGRSERRGMYPMSTWLVATDTRGKVFDMTGAAINCAPWAPYPSVIYTQSLLRWNCNGRIGYGVQQDVLSRSWFGRNRECMR